MTKTIDQLREEITQAFSIHWTLNDAAHRADHFEEVFQTAKVLVERIQLHKAFDEKLMLFTAYFHDLFAWSRHNHHELSYEFVLNTDHPVITQNLTPEERETVAWACRQHRASFGGDFKNAFAQLMNAADRGFPGSVDQLLKRAIQYRMARRQTESLTQIKDDAVQHVKDKFGSHGYARYPEVYQLVFEYELANLKQAVDQL